MRGVPIPVIEDDPGTTKLSKLNRAPDTAIVGIVSSVDAPDFTVIV
jgi:hypothetical protein